MAPTTKHLLDQAPPCDAEVERQLLGSVMLDFSVLGELSLRSSDFYADDHQLMFAELATIHREGRPFDLTLFVSRLRSKNVRGESGLDAVGGQGYIEKTFSSVSNPSHARHYAEVVRDLACRRQLRHRCEAWIQGAHNGQPISELIDRAVRDLVHIRDGTSSESRGIEYNILTAAELDKSEFSLEFLVKDVLVARHNCGIVGGSKTLKTSIAVDLGISLATAGYFLGRFEVTRKCRTCLMSGESGLPVLQDTARRIAAEANWMLRKIDGLLFCDMLPRLEDLGHIVALERLIQRQRIEVLIIDPMYLAIDVDGKESSMFAMGRVLRNIGQLCQEHGVTLVMCHHAKQTATREPKKPDFRDAAFSGFEQFFAQWVCVSRRSEYLAGSGHHELWLRCEGRMGHSGQWALDVDEGLFDGPGTRIWKTQVTSENNAEHDAAAKLEAQQGEHEKRKLAAEREKMMKAYQRFSSGETMKQIAALAGISHQRFAAVNATLLDDGLVELCEVQKSCRNTPYDGFKITTKGQLYDHRDQRD